MYNDSWDYLEFIINALDLRCHSKVLTSQKWDQINEEFYKNRVVVIDDFLNEEYAYKLRNFMLFTQPKQDFYKDYAAFNFKKENYNIWFPILDVIIDECKENLKFLQDLNFIRGWSFIYNNKADGVPPHADPAAINLNLWVTPNESLNLDNDKNGLDIWKIYPPEDWKDSYLYNGDTEGITNYLEKQSPEKISIDYKFNRIVIFDSKYFHKTQPVDCKSGYENRRINYTFLYS